MQKTTTWTGLGVAGALTAAALIIPGISAAQGDDPTDDSADETAQDREALHAERHQEFIDALAEELGISPEELEEAFENVRAEMREERLAALRERLDQRVADGDLTQEQADEIYERAEDGEWPFGRRGHHGPRGRFGPGGPFGPLDDGGDDAPEDASAQSSAA